MFKALISFYLTIAVPLLYFLNLILIVLYKNTLPFSFNVLIIGILLTIIGLIFWIISFISLGKSFNILPSKQKRIKKGIYKYFSHPMYFGIVLTFLGLSFACFSKQGLIFSLLILIPLLIIRVLIEERLLI